MHDQVGTDGGGGFAAGIRMLLQSALDPGQPFVELFRATAVHRWKRTDHPVAASGYHEFDTRHEKHRRRNQRQAEAIAKARKKIGWLRHAGLSSFLVVLALFSF